jgi:hypothetical protein
MVLGWSYKGNVKRISRALAVLTAVGLLTCGVAETWHHRRFGDFFGYGPHADVILGNSDIGTDDMYYANLSNFSLASFELEGCLFASDVFGVPDSVLYRWDVQKWDNISGKWVATPFGGYWNEEPCRPTLTRMAPLQTRQVAWVFKDWVTAGESVRMAIHTSIRKSLSQQTIICTDAFVVKRVAAP